MKIVSLTGSATEIVCALGLGEGLVGISHDSDYPPAVRRLPVLTRPKVTASGGAQIDAEIRGLVQEGLSIYEIDEELLARLAPDLIITQDQCHVCAVPLGQVEEEVRGLTLKNTRVLSVSPHTLAEVKESFIQIAESTAASKTGAALAEEFGRRLDALRGRTTLLAKPRALLLEWLDPPMAAGGWIPEMARIAGAEPIGVEAGQSFRRMSWGEVAAVDSDVLLAFPCDYTVEETIREMNSPGIGPTLTDLRAARQAACFAADGREYFNRPGPRLAEAAELLAALFHPGRLPEIEAREKNRFAVWMPA